MNIKDFFVTASDKEIESLRNCTDENSIKEFANKRNITLDEDEMNKLLSLVRKELNDTELLMANGGAIPEFKKQQGGFGFCNKRKSYIYKNADKSRAYGCGDFDDGLSIFSRPKPDGNKIYENCLNCMYYSCE